MEKGLCIRVGLEAKRSSQGTELQDGTRDRAAGWNAGQPAIGQCGAYKDGES